MHRIFLILLIALSGAAVGVHGVLADGATATVSPGTGDMHTTFSLSAAGLTPGHSLLIVIFDAAGSRYTYQKDGMDQAIVVDDGGAAGLQVTPASDLPGSVPGSWQAVFTEQETGYTATIPFDVAP